MTATNAWIIHTDGAARGNPGPAAIAYIIERPGEKDIEFKECLGTATNNVAEYTALVRALEHALKLGGRRLAIHSDSELLVRQMAGHYKVKNPNILPLYEQAMDLARQLDSVDFHHVRRDKNTRADALCNAALDGEKPKTRPRPSSKPSADRVALIRDEAIECLRNAANAWSHGGKQLTPEHVWDQLASILEEAGVLPAK